MASFSVSGLPLGPWAAASVRLSTQAMSANQVQHTRRPKERTRIKTLLDRLLLGSRRRLRLRRFAHGRLEAGRQLLRRPGAPVVQEVDRRLRARHVMVDRDDI